VRAELASWALLSADPALAAAAADRLEDLERSRRAAAAGRAASLPSADRSGRAVFDAGLSPAEKSRLATILDDPTFLEESIRIIFEAEDLGAGALGPDGVRISPLSPTDGRPAFRIRVEAGAGRRFDLRLVLRDGSETVAERETRLWSLALSRAASGRSVLPDIGCIRPDLGAASLRCLDGIDVGSRLRSMDPGRAGDAAAAPGEWRRLFIGGMAAFFRAWELSGRRIVPGRTSPENVIVPESDSGEEGVLLSLAGWAPCAGPLSLVRPLVVHFYGETASRFPAMRGRTDPAWIFDACYEALGSAAASEFFAALRADPDLASVSFPGGASIAAALDAYLADFRKNAPIPRPALSAAARYEEWEIRAGKTSPEERERKAYEVFALYRLSRFPEVVRYGLFRRTYFAGAPERALAAFDALLARMRERPDVPAVRLVELSELQAALDRDADRAVLARLAFPGLAAGRTLEITESGEGSAKRVIVRSAIAGRRGGAFAFRETYDPAEIGQLYRLLFREGRPTAVSDQDRHLVLLDGAERIAGGLVYRMTFEGAAFIDAIVVAAPLQGAGLASGMIEDFCGRMAASGVPVVLTHFERPELFRRAGFELDRRWGAMVRHTRPPL
jgi:hypothetical protein